MNIFDFIPEKCNSKVLESNMFDLIMAHEEEITG